MAPIEKAGIQYATQLAFGARASWVFLFAVFLSASSAHGQQQTDTVKRIIIMEDGVDASSSEPDSSRIKDNYYRITLGIASSTFATGGSAGVYEATFQHKANVFTFGVVDGNESLPESPMGLVKQPAEITEYDALYGRGYVDGILFMSISAGVSLNHYLVTSANYYDSTGFEPPAYFYNIHTYPSRSYYGIGFPIQGQLMFDFSSVFGIGFFGYLNLNFTQIVGGIGMTAQIGWF